MTQSDEFMHLVKPVCYSKLSHFIQATAGWILFVALIWGAGSAAAQSGPLTLDQYPRPQGDNGWGVHWSPTLLAQPQDVVERYVAELEALDLHWVKLMQPDQPRLEHTYLIAQLRQRQIEPVLRVQKTYNDPYQSLSALVTAGTAAGVHYYELYSNANVAGLDGGWRPRQAIDVDLLARQWASAARTVRAAGGYPGLPSLSPGGAIDDTVFLRRFLQALQRDNALDSLNGAWLPIQSYTGNRPLTDKEGFQKFETYHQIVAEVTNRVLPILATEGGTLVGDYSDPRYPVTDEATAAERTGEAFVYMRDAAPDYFFAFMPWLLVNAAAGGTANAWEADAWFPAGEEPRPVVDVIKALAGTEPEPVIPQPLPTNVQYAAATPTVAAEFKTATQAVAQLPIAETTPTPTGSQRTVSSGEVSVYEGNLTLPTYDYKSAFLPTTRDDVIWPEPRLDHDRVGAPTPQTYRTLVLENDFVRLTLLPELGGRIYRWEDKVSGRDILYHNSVVKPTRWGVRGWWLALGGIEWGFPLPDHGLYEYKPWRAETIAESRSAGVRLYQNGPDGLAVIITVSLNADTRFFAVTSELTNNGNEPLSTHFWQNAMLAPNGNNQVHPETRLIWPTDELIVHGSMGNQHLPMGGTVTWPAGSGVDLSKLSTWPQHLSFFGLGMPRQGAIGLADPEGELAVIRSFPQRLVPGIKAFYGAGLDPALWTDDSGRYVELWGGPAKHFNTPISLAAGQTLRWTEQWYTVPGLGEFVTANAHAALALQSNHSNTELRLASTGASSVQGGVTLVVRIDGTAVVNEEITLSTSEIYRRHIPYSLHDHHWIVQVINNQNNVLLSYDNRAEPAPVPVEAPMVDERVEWDERLDDLNIEVIPANVKPGQSYWKIIKAEFQNPEEGGGRHHIYIEVLDEAGERILDQEVEVFWADGSASVFTEDKPAPEYAANFPMYNNLGGYSARIPGPSDTVTGMGLPGGRQHVVYNLVFQRTVKQ